jgi:outer membrane protein OmpA-like peptidoglycan-associated protein
MNEKQEATEVKLKRKFDGRQAAVINKKPANTARWIMIASLLVISGLAVWYFTRSPAVPATDSANSVATKKDSVTARAGGTDSAGKVSAIAGNAATKSPVTDTTATVTEAKTNTTAEQAKGKAAVTRPAVAYFKAGSSKFSSVADEEINALIIFLKANPGSRLSINGYASSEGNLAVNEELSRRRAEVFKIYLIKKGVSPDRLTTSGLGISDPAASNQSAAGRSKNRRVEAVK